MNFIYMYGTDYYVFWSVRPFVCPSVRSSRFGLKFWVKVVLAEVEVQST